MTADHHPEELIDRAIRGALDPDEQSTLDRHLAHAPRAQAHVALAPRFEQELAPQPRDEILDQRAVEAAMQRMQRRIASLRRPKPRLAAMVAPGGGGGVAGVRCHRDGGDRRAQDLLARARRVTRSFDPSRLPRARSAPLREKRPRLMCRSRLNSRRRASYRRALLPPGPRSRRQGSSSAPASCAARDTPTRPSPSTAVCRRPFPTRGRPGCRSRSPVSCCSSEDGRATRWRSSIDIRRLAGTSAKRRSRVAPPRSSSSNRTADAIAAWKSLARTLSGIRLRCACARASGPAGRAAGEPRAVCPLRRVPAGHLLRGPAGRRGERAFDEPSRRARRRAAP